MFLHPVDISYASLPPQSLRHRHRVSNASCLRDILDRDTPTLALIDPMHRLATISVGLLLLALWAQTPGAQTSPGFSIHVTNPLGLEYAVISTFVQSGDVVPEISKSPLSNRLVRVNMSLTLL